MIAKESSADAQAQQWLAAEYARPATVGEIAQAVGGDQALAAETYLAARMVCGDLERKEIVFLAQLAQALNLDDKLVDQLEQQLGLVKRRNRNESFVRSRLAEAGKTLGMGGRQFRRRHRPPAAARTASHCPCGGWRLNATTARSASSFSTVRASLPCQHWTDFSI